MNLELKAVGGKAVLAVPASRPPWGMVLRFDLDDATPSGVVGTIDEQIPIPGAGLIHFRWRGDLASLLRAATTAEYGDAMALLNDERLQGWRDHEITLQMLKQSLDDYDARQASPAAD